MTPPVYFQTSQEALGKENSWITEKEYLSDFLIAVTYHQASWGLEYAGDFLSIDPEGIEYIRKNYQSKQADLLASRLEFYGNYDDSVIALTKTGSDEYLFYSSCTEEHFYEMHNDLSVWGKPLC